MLIVHILGWVIFLFGCTCIVGCMDFVQNPEHDALKAQIIYKDNPINTGQKLYNAEWKRWLVIMVIYTLLNAFTGKILFVPTTFFLTSETMYLCKLVKYRSAPSSPETVFSAMYARTTYDKIIEAMQVASVLGIGIILIWGV